MKKLSEISKDTMLIIMENACDGVVMDKEDFLQSHYYIDKDYANVKVAIADEMYASFDLESALQSIGEDEMHEDWLENVMDKLSDARENIEKIINAVLETEPTYYDGEKLEW